VKSIDAIAMAAIMHDIGKFYQRTGIEAEEGNMHLYCKRNKEGYLTHHHALYTAQAIDRLQKQGWLKPFIECEIFQDDDSFINAAAMHHVPKTKIQWIVAVADRVSSGFERETFEREYNDKTESPDFLRSRLIPIFETLSGKEKHGFHYRYPLRPFDENFAPLSVNEVMPKDKDTAKREYSLLYTEFEESLNTIKERIDATLILDAFDSALRHYTFAIPSATAMGTMPTVSLYDHSRSSAAFAAALWQYHENDDGATLNTKEGWEEKKFLLIQGDFWGIQKFIFSGSEENSRHIAKQLRGKSASVALMSELAALKVVDALGLSITNIVQNIAGKFLIVAANTAKNRDVLEKIENELNAWFLENSYAEAGIVLSKVSASCNDMSHKNLAPIMGELAGETELKKSRKFDLNKLETSVFYDYLSKMEGKEPCVACGIHPAEPINDGECELCGFLTWFGKKLASPHTRHLYIYRQKAAFDIFGYEVDFFYDDNRELVTKWDITLPNESGKRFEGVAIRTLKAYIPVDHEGKPLEFSEIASSGTGQKALSAFKADVDNLGALFLEKLPLRGEMSFARYNMTSRLIDHFFSVETPYFCTTKFRHVYTIFSGGDDLFVIGPWDVIERFAVELKQRFDRYFITEESDMTFSAGVVMVHDKTPVTFIAQESEDALERMKTDGKNGVRIFDNSVKYIDFIDLMELSETLDIERKKLNVSTGFFYSLSQLARMKERMHEDVSNALWNSKLRYSGMRNVIERNKDKKDDANRFIETIAHNIKIYGQAFEVAVFTSLYKERNDALR